MVLDQAETRSLYPSRRQGTACLVLAVLFLLAWAAPGVWPEAVHERLREAIKLEAFVIISFLVFAILAVQKTEKAWHRFLKWSLALLYGSFFMLIAVESDEGPGVVIDVVVLLFVTYGGILWRKPAPGAMAVAAVRWAFSFLSLFVWMALVIGGYQGVFGRDENVDLLVGAFFFGLLGALDVVNAFERFVRHRQALVKRRRG